jgi:putative membrane protein
MKNVLFLLALDIALFAGPVVAQSASTDTATKDFIVQASIAGIQEVSAGRLASEKAVDPEVKSYGAKMVADHSKAEDQLLQLAKKKGYEIPATATTPAASNPMLKKASGKDFDREYVHMMVPDHRDAVQLFQKYAINGKDPDIKAFAQQTLQVIKQHLAQITAIDNKMKGATTK